jgi:hypothetical protein
MLGEVFGQLAAVPFSILFDAFDIRLDEKYR